MKSACAAFNLAAALLLACWRGSFATKNPVVGVIKLLQDLDAQVKTEGQAEELEFEKFQHWCVRGLKALDAAMTKEKTSIQELSDKLMAGGQRIESLGGEIKELRDQESKIGGKNEAAAKQREEESSVAGAKNADFHETIETLNTVIAELQATKESVSLAQLRRPQVYAALLAAASRSSESGVGVQMQQNVADLLQALTADPSDADPLLARGDRDRHVQASKFHSDGLIEMFKELRSQFEEEAVEFNKAEQNRVNAFALADAARQDLASATTSSRAAKEEAKSGAEAKMGQWASDLEQLQADLAVDTRERKTTNAECSARSDEWAKRSSIREAEGQAMAAAIDILSKVSGVRAPGHEAEAAMFLQVDDPRMKAVNLLRSTAKATHSKALATLAQQIAVHLGEPIAEVSNMIEKLVFRLMDDQRKDDEHQAWCAEEVSKNERARDAKAEKLEELGSGVASLTARASGLATEVTRAQEAVSALASFVEEATAMRRESKAENAAALKDAEDAQNALSQAVAVLETFYKHGESEALLQEPVELPEKPNLWSSPYTGVADPKAQPEGIITVLNELSAKFSTMEANVRAQETAEAQAFQEDMSAAKVGRARHAKASQVKSAERKSVVARLGEEDEDQKRVSSEHSAVEQYLAQLASACGDKPGDPMALSYKERKAARVKEADALREAQRILEGAKAAEKTAFLAIRNHVSSP